MHSSVVFLRSPVVAATVRCWLFSVVVPHKYGSKELYNAVRPYYSSSYSEFSFLVVDGRKI